MKAQAVLFDLDDTLLRDDRSISPYTLSVLRRASEAGVHVIPASGRAQPSMEPFVRQIGCASCYISCNGAEIWSAEHRLLHQEALGVEDARECARFAAENDCHAQVYYGDMFYFSSNNEYARAYEKSSMMKGKYVGDLEKFIDRPLCKFLMTDRPERIAQLYEMAKARFGDRAAVTCSKPYFLEINPLRASKGLALGTAAKLLGIDPALTVAFGDGLNDMSMLTAAGTGVAVANAWAEVKARIPVHCLSNMEDGVAHFIEDNILKEAEA